jgi:phosphatidylinositol alpha 1,6-mannosyltransferase
MRVRHGFVVRVAVVTDSFLPEVNGVTNSVLRVLEHLQGHGHQALVLAAGRGGPASYAGATVVRALSVPVPRYRSLSIGLPSPRVEAALRLFRPELVHLASPVVLGAHGVAVARRLAVPAVAVYQTDVPAFLGRYGLGVAEPATWRWLHWIHRRADLTLAPSTHTVEALARHGITGVEVWRRGVDAERFHPRHRSLALRRRLAPGGEVLVGYVGRLAAEKRPELAVAAVAELLGRWPGARLVVAGAGPLGPRLAALARGLPVAFIGYLADRRELAALLATADVVLAPGPVETFGLPAPRVYLVTVPRSVVQLARRELAGLRLGADADTLGTPDDRLTTTVDVRPWLDRKWAAMRAHASQFGPGSPLDDLPEPLRAALLGTEWFVRRR